MPVPQRALDDPRQAAGPVVAVADEQAHAASIALNDEPVAVVLDLYEGLACQEVFSRSAFFSSYVSRRLARAQFCIDGTAGPLLAALSRSTPGARRVAPEGESARRATMVAGHYAANVTAFLLILFSPFQ
jgi:hypothetical protein